MRRPFRIRPSSLLRVLLAFVGALPWAFVALGRGAQGLRPLFGSFCHQLPERSLAFFGVPMVVCSRCAGIYAGVALGAVLPPPRFIVRHGRAVVLAAALALLLDVIVQGHVAHAVCHPLRLMTGLLAGWAGCAFVLGAMDDERRADATPQPAPPATSAAERAGHEG